MLSPSLSVVIGSRNAEGSLDACLASLQTQVDDTVQVIVAEASTDGTAELVTGRYPWATLVQCATETGIGRVRAAGLRVAEGDVIAFTDPFCRVAPNWVATLRRQEWQRYAAVGGVVVPAPRAHATDWAAFLNEYAPHLTPQPAGEATILTGNNVGFRRSALEHAGLLTESEFWKTFALWRLAERGERFWVDPELVVQHAKSTPGLDFLIGRYLHGRCFGATRVAGQPLRSRLARALTCPALPLVFTSRLVRSVNSNATYRRVLWRSLPINLIFHTAWAVGELDGYLRGPGTACARLT